MALIGKGGSGKSIIAGTLCRQLGRAGWSVLALDIDTMPGLALSLGAPPGEARLPSGLSARVESRRGMRWKIQKGAGAAHLVDTHALVCRDGVRLLELGKLPGRVEPNVTVTFRHVVERFRRPRWAMVADLAAGTRQPIFGWSDFAGVRLVVVEPNAKGILTARRLTTVGTHIVVNKVRADKDVARVRDAIDLPVAAAIPYDEEVAAAEQRGLAAVDAAPGSAAVQAVGELAAWLGGPP